MRRREFVAGLGSLALGVPPACAQGYPDRLIKLILPFTAGSPNDVLARFFVPHLSGRIAQPVIVENVRAAAP